MLMETKHSNSTHVRKTARVLGHGELSQLNSVVAPRKGCVWLSNPGSREQHFLRWNQPAHAGPCETSRENISVAQG